jgi:hypothetical protein
VPKVIRAASSTPGGWSVDDDADAVAATARAVRSAVEACDPAHVAVLTRVNASLAPIQAALVEMGVPIAGGVGLEFLERTSVRAVLAWLRLAGAGGRGRWDADDLREALRRPSRALAPRVAEWVTEQVEVAGLRRLAARLNQPREQERVAELADDLDLLAGLVGRGAPTATVVAALLDRIGLAGSVAGLDATRHGMNRGAQGDDLTAVRHLADLHPDVATFERWLRDQLATRRRPDGVLLATVHRVKGQEWPHVIVHLAGADQFPHRLADDVEEERRLFHVALTRGREHVTVVTGPAASPFVAELTSEPDERELARQAGEALFARMGARRAAEPRRASAPDHPLVDRDHVPAVAGLVLVDHGSEWVVTEVAEDHVMATNGAATRRWRHGEPVVTRGRRRGALGSPPDGVAREAVLAYDELRRWRDLVRDGKPAYTVFDDKTLAAIATALPSTSGELAAVRGVGPAKLESYGPDVLGLVAEVLDGVAPSGA